MASPTLTPLDNPFLASTPPSEVNPTSLPPPPGSSSCLPWETAQSIVFQLASIILIIAFAAPSTNGTAKLVTHTLLVVGFVIMAAWAWQYICAHDIFGWCLVFAVLNLCHTIYLSWTMRPVNLTPEQRELYNKVFKSFKVPRHVFKKLCYYGKITSLKIGEHYSEEGKSQCVRLSMLLMGKVKVFCEGEFLHHIVERQFLDSPEWDSCEKSEKAEFFQVTLTASTYCRYITWHRDQLHDFLENEPYLKQVFTNLIGSDISKKLFMLTERNLNQKGGRADIRLPSAGRRPANNYDMSGHLAAGTRGACGTGIPVIHRTSAGDDRPIGRSGREIVPV
ncbi:popeye domain-containing protein 3 [Strongylocentrotus purpuratus]|uniref:POPDC1-3 domain-containing protein n=1 Tax=Strongylocentrotus purpuratus TaxID=7668 RepID=A0A7M7RBL2_STRPU|nr:popeye domain-containing protein 3 [Strongylocentrotus purpuratus]XP_785876.3 popeye domain-containing protein 3 [Strongylocentrotus purpuratus]|eukprot:XP_011670673.1 PREDICTED: popeye domain-containing protein 3 [Strongylocentrotus purpuratus]